MACSPPRVTIVSANPIRDDQPNGILMKSLFCDWPREKLTQVYFPAVAMHQPDWGVCHDYRRILCWGQQQTLSPPSGMIPKGPSHAAFASRLKRSPTLMKWLRVGLEAWTTHVAPMRRALERQLRQTRPDCVYALLGNYWLTRVTVDACRALGLPLYVHVTDDFVTALYRDQPFGDRLGRASEQAFADAVQYADGLAAISPVMAEAYERRYGKSWDWFTTLIDANQYDPSPRKPGSPLNLVYTGGVELGRAQTLLSLAEELQAVEAAGGVRAVLSIYTSQEGLALHGDSFRRNPQIQVKGWATPSTLPAIFRDADAVVHVESQDPEIAAYTRLSFSTKLSQYMMAARPILGIGPRELGSMEMIRRAGAGVTLSQGEATLTTELRAFLADPGYRRQLGEQGRRWAERWFDGPTRRGAFQESLTGVLHTSANGNNVSRAA